MSRQSLINQIQPQSSKNIKNIYVKKINSLLELSGDNAKLFSKEKKVKKQESTLSQQFREISKREKNKESARKARLRKKIYINLLQKTINDMEKWVQLGQNLEKESRQYMNQIYSEVKTINSTSSKQNIDQYFFYEQKISKKKIHNDNEIVQYTKQINQNFYFPFIKNVATLPQFKQKMDIQSIANQISQQQKKLESVTNQANNLLEQCQKDSTTKVEHQVGLVDEFLLRMEIQQLQDSQKNEKDFNIKYAQNLKLRLDNFLNLKV